MKKGIHPEINQVSAHCACGKMRQISTTTTNVHTTLCSACHPFFTGKQKFVDTAGRIEKFNKRFKNFDGQEGSSKKSKKK